MALDINDIKPHLGPFHAAQGLAIAQVAQAAARDLLADSDTPVVIGGASLDAVRGAFEDAKYLLPYVRASASEVLAEAYRISARPIDTAAAALSTAAPTALPTRTMYYIDPLHPSASNTNAGTSPDAPWASLTKLVGFSPAAGSDICLAADVVFEHATTLAQYFGRTIFTYQGADNLRGTLANPITIRPYYPRPAPALSMPKVRYFAQSVAGDWTQEPGMGGKVWSCAVTGAESNGHTLYVLFGESEDVGVNPKAPVGAPYGHSPLNMTGAKQFSLDLFTNPTKLYVYVPDGTNPVTYYGVVRVGGMPLLQSYWEGLRHTRITGIKFELCTAACSFSSSNGANGAVIGLKIDNCWFNKAGALNYANRTTYSSALEGEVDVHGNLFTDCPNVGIRFQPCTGTAGNALQWRVYENRVFGANLSTSHMSWFYNQARGGTFYRAWANYGYDIRNGTGGNSIDGCLLYADLSSENTEFVGNVCEWSGVAYQSNNAVNCTIAANIAIDCVKLAMITASTDGAVTNMSTRCNHNTWLYTGRRAIPQRGPNVPVEAPIVAWNDKALASGATYKWARLEIINNALCDLSGIYATKEAVKYTGNQATVLVVGGFAIAGFGARKVANYGTDFGVAPVDRTNFPWMVRVMGDGNGEAWFEGAENGCVAPSLNSPLRASGVPLSPAWADYSGTPFSETAPDIGAIRHAI